MKYSKVCREKPSEADASLCLSSGRVESRVMRLRLAFPLRPNLRATRRRPDAQGRDMRAILTKGPECSEQHDAILEKLSGLSSRVSRGRWDISP